MAKKKSHPSGKKSKRKAPKSKASNRLYPVLLFILISVVVVAAAIIAYYQFWRPSGQKDQDFSAGMFHKAFKKQGDLTFISSRGDSIVSIDIEIADDSIERQIGLMHRDRLQDNQGMFFMFADESPQAFWMKNTIIPLDIIFINSDLEIVTVYRNTQPFSETQLVSEAPALYVVEVNAGFTEKHGIKAGDRVNWNRI